MKSTSKQKQTATAKSTPAKNSKPAKQIARRSTKPWPQIRLVTNRDGSTSYMVDTRINGMGKRYFYETKAEAQTVAETARIKRRNEGDSAFGMSNADRVDAERALEVLAKHGITLKAAADFSLRHLSTVTTDRLVGDVVDELLLKLKQDGKSSYYLNSNASIWKRFAADHADLRMSDIDTPKADKWLRALEGISGDTRNGYRDQLSTLFLYAVSQKYAVDNPFKAVAKAKSERGIPQVLNVSQVITLLKCADHRFMPSLLLGVFAGLRPWSEVCRLRWERIDFEKKRIDIAPGCTKNQKSVRFVKMSDNLVQWLLPYRKKSGLVIDSVHVYNDLREKMASHAGFTSTTKYAGERIQMGTGEHGDWTQDVLRHTFASMHMAEHEDTSLTIGQMGHVGTDILFKHYRARVTPEEAKTFWNIRPVTLEAKVVRPSMLMPDLLAEVVASKDDEDPEAFHTEGLRNVESVGGRFCQAHPLLKVSEVENSDIEKWLSGLKLSDPSRAAYRYTLARVFNFAVERGYCTFNPTRPGDARPLLDVSVTRPDNIVSMMAAV